MITSSNHIFLIRAKTTGGLRYFAERRRQFNRVVSCKDKAHCVSKLNRIQLNRIANRVIDARGTVRSCEEVPERNENSRLRVKLDGGREEDEILTSSHAQDVNCYGGEREDIDNLVEYLETLADWYGDSESL